MGRRVQIMSWKQTITKDPDPNKAKPEYRHPPTHKQENPHASPSSTRIIQSKPIKMGGDVM